MGERAVINRRGTIHSVIPTADFVQIGRFASVVGPETSSGLGGIASGSTYVGVILISVALTFSRFRIIFSQHTFSGPVPWAPQWFSSHALAHEGDVKQ